MAKDAPVEEEKKGIKMEEVEKHSSIDDLWLVIDGACDAAFLSTIDELRLGCLLDNKRPTVTRR